MAGKRQDDGIAVAEGAKRRRAGGAGRGDAVMNAVGGLVGHDDVGLHRLEKAVHLVVLFIHPDSRPVLDDVALGDPGRPDVRPAVARDPQLVELVPVEVEVLLMERGVLEVHVVVAGKAEDAGVLLQGDDVLQDLVFLLHDPPRPDRVLLVGRSPSAGSPPGRRDRRGVHRRNPRCPCRSFPSGRATRGNRSGVRGSGWPSPCCRRGYRSDRRR